MGELVAELRRFGELDVRDELAAALTPIVTGHRGPAPGRGQGCDVTTRP